MKMDEKETEDGIERAFSKDELLEVYKRLESGDETALDLWCLYFATLGSYSAGKCANNAYGIWHADLFTEHYDAAWGVSADIGRSVLEGTTKIEGDPENYVWAAIRYKMIADDKKDRGDGSTRSKAGWQAKRWKFNEVEIPVVTSNMSEILEEVSVCLDNDVDRKVIRLFIENGDDPKEVARLAELAIEEVQHLRGIVAERMARRMREQGEPSPWLEKQAKKLKSVRKRRKQSPKQSNVWPADKPKGSKAKATKQAK
jgi:hypothetical protein